MYVCMYVLLLFSECMYVCIFIYCFIPYITCSCERVFQPPQCIAPPFGDVRLIKFPSLPVQPRLLFDAFMQMTTSYQTNSNELLIKCQLINLVERMLDSIVTEGYRPLEYWTSTMINLLAARPI